jgi:hypothetical protein
MTPIQKLAASYFLLGALFAATLIVGLYVGFPPRLGSMRPWITPLCLLTCLSALMVSRLHKNFTVGRSTRRDR